MRKFSLLESSITWERITHHQGERETRDKALVKEEVDELNLNAYRVSLVVSNIHLIDPWPV